MSQHHRLSPKNFFERITFSAVLAPAIVLAIVIGFSSIDCQAETWTDLNGTRSIEAKMLGVWNGNVILEIGGSRRVAVPMDFLRSESRIQAQDLWEEIKRNRKSRVEEMKGLAIAAAAPAPNPLPKPSPAPAYQKPPADAKFTDFMQTYDDQVASGHLLLARFDVLPPSYRADVEELVKLAAAQIDPNQWQALTTGLHQMGDLVVTRQNWFFSTPRLKDLPADQLDSLQQQILLVSGILRDGFQPDAMQLTQLQSTDFREWLAQRDQAVSPYLAAINSQLDASESRQFAVVKETAETADVKMSKSGDETNVKFQKVEGFWVPESLASTWAESVAAKKIEFQQGTVLPEFEDLAAIQPVLFTLASAGNAEQFHEVVETIFPLLPPLVAKVASIAGTDMDLASNSRRSSRGPSGYEDEDGMSEEEMEEMMMEEMMEEEMRDEP